VVVRSSISVGIPLDATAGTLSAVAALIDDFEACCWGKLAERCMRLAEADVRWAPPAALLLERLAIELRRAAAGRPESVKVHSSRL